ncbi:MAG: F0F1 ATP synthase subunit alpha [Candidatus Woesebacteria bacterium]
MKQFSTYLESTGEIGYVVELRPGIVSVQGLPKVKLFELVILEDNTQGQVIGMSRDRVDLILFTNTPVKVGTKVARTNERLQIPVGVGVCGTTISPMGDRLDSIEPIVATETRSIDTRPGGIMVRAPIDKTLETGVSVVDTVVPLARGQRELVIGDRKSGKTSFLLQTVISQARMGVICIYCAVGKRETDIKHLEENFSKNGIRDKTVIVAATSTESSGLQFLAPYSAITIAEYFRDQGQDSLVVFDDLTAHANIYREISLLLRRFPGRSAYPGDIFYTHARLLERGGNFKVGTGSTSITCLPVVQSVIGDLAGYITTNVMSMTDGHIFFDMQLFDQGRRPAVNPFLSVTRVGLQAQTPLLRDLSRQLSSFLVYYERIKQYTHFGSEVSQSVRDAIGLGERISVFFQQLPNEIVPMAVNVYTLALLWTGLWSDQTGIKLKPILRTIVDRYQKDATFKKTIDDMISSSATFQDVTNKAKTSSDSMGVRYGK